MDQDSFRQLLQTPRPGASGTPTTRGSLLGQARKPTTTTKKAANEPAFKPRNIKKGKDDDKKKKDAKWRDRAAERREGKDGDFADVEAVLKEFEERNEGEEDMEDKRAYLGGDAEHSVLVRGLDRALLQQNRARLSSVTNAEADEDLEEVFSTLPTASLDAAPIQAPSKGDGKKRSRADILAELKAKRDGSAPVVAEAAPLPNNKFKPIAASGFKPIGEKKKKKKRAKEDGAGGEDGDRKKKKRKVEADAGVADVQVGSTDAMTKEAEAPAPPAPEPEPEPVDEDFDIFADAGEYEGVVESDSDSDADAPRPPSPPPVSGPPRRGWFDEPEPSPPPTAPSPPPQVDKGKGKAPAPNDEEGEEGEMQEGEEGEMQEEEEEQPIRLQPLASSTVPSIREILAADKAAEKEEARKARKEKKKKGQGEMTEEAKINRELQKMKALEAKKAK